MACEHVKIGDTHAIICGRRVKGVRCGFCQRTSSRLCDAVVGVTLGGDPITCDAPICGSCTRQVGDDKDFCPKHQG